jgi:hypothetical protein
MKQLSNNNALSGDFYKIKNLLEKICARAQLYYF